MSPERDRNRTGNTNRRRRRRREPEETAQRGRGRKGLVRKIFGRKVQRSQNRQREKKNRKYSHHFPCLFRRTACPA